MRLVQLSRAEHADLRVDPLKARQAAANVHLVPIVRSELRRACAHYPVFFVKDPETGQFYLAALMGLEPHENLYWNGDALEAGYVPLNLLRLPFYVGGDDTAGGVICVDADSPGAVAEGPCAILDADGNDSAYMVSIQSILTELAGQHGATRAFVDQVVAHGLLEEVKLDIVFDDRSSTVLTGFYGINERTLAREAGKIGDFDDVIASVATIVSLEHVAGLVARRNARNASEAEWLAASSSP